MNPTPLQQQPQNHQHQQTQADPEQNNAPETRTAKKLCCDNFADIAEETTRESGQNGSHLSTHHLTNHQSTENALLINPVGDNNQICMIIDSVNTTITINSSLTYLPRTAHARPGDTQTASISMHRPQHPEPNRNRVEESQDMENMKLCISTLSIIRSRASTPTPKLTYSQVTAQGKKYNQMDIDQIEQWTSGPLKSEGSNPGNTSISSCGTMTG
ncbi:hypothetical protein C2G38_2327090 [Gigaspora rosea]|uniref:Uncharacterized protein n=1 Tax=Gigaspora rosea TaxID=44941 RepID=A0A397UUI6_9GLOM|nr:hypothetical protein C2G38_2327090 [Gigaspora rosea]